MRSCERRAQTRSPGAAQPPRRAGSVVLSCLLPPPTERRSDGRADGALPAVTSRERQFGAPSRDVAPVAAFRPITPGLAPYGRLIRAAVGPPATGSRAARTRFSPEMAHIASILPEEVELMPEVGRAVGWGGRCARRSRLGAPPARSSDGAPASNFCSRQLTPTVTAF